MSFKYNGQAAQDLLVYELIVKPDNKLNGSFLDVGCGHPTIINNTYALEQIGWTGLLIDNSQEAIDACKGVRKSPCVKGDAVAFGWNLIANPVIDYLSLDIDESNYAALQSILKAGLKFRVITVEHDAYRHGDLLRAPIREALKDYDLVCADVCALDGSPYEDWYVSRDLSERANRFRSTGLKWPDIFKQAGVKL